MGATSIEWTEKTWNPVRGCSLVSAGCANCYAMKMAHRFSGKGQPYEGLTEMSKHGPRWTGKVVFVPEMLDLPLRTKKPAMWFVNSMSDLFHADITNEQIAAVFGVMAACPQHTFQVLTKRPERAAEFFSWLRQQDDGVPLHGDRWSAWAQFELSDGSGEGEERAFWDLRRRFDDRGGFCKWPLPNVWLGVSAENQATADERIPILLTLPAAVRFVSAEPLLGPVDLRSLVTSQGVVVSALTGDETHKEFVNNLLHPNLDWVIAGGESGPGARSCDVVWIRGIVEQCKAADVPVFVKQLGAKPYESDGAGQKYDELRLKDRKGGTMEEWPEDLRVRQMPQRFKEAAE